MGNIVLHSEQKIHTTTIENRFIDTYMTHANGDYVKIYLFLIRAIQAGCNDISISMIADRFDSTDRDVIRALKYWEKTGVLAISWDSLGEISLIRILDLSETNHTDINSQTDMDSISAPVKADNNAPGTASGDIHTVKNIDYEFKISHVSSNEKISDDFTDSSILKREDTLFSDLCDIIEGYLNRIMKPMEVDVLAFIYKDLHFSTELIMHLYGYCINLNKTKPSYIQKVAIDWANNGISTVEEANKYCEKYNTAYNAIKKKFNTQAPLTPKQRGYIDKWINEYGFNLDIVINGCERAVNNISEPIRYWDYTDKIMQNWHNDGITNMEDINRADEKFAAEKDKKHKYNNYGKSVVKSDNKPVINSFTSFPQRNISKEEMEKLEKKITI